MTRRTFLTCAGAATAAGLGLRAARERDERGLRADVFISRADSYEGELAAGIRAGLEELGLGTHAVRGKRILLKPNLVEPSREQPHINTHPAVVRASAEVFRSWQAGEVLVAEGQGHCRDSQYVLEESGLDPVLEEERLTFVDLNHDDVLAVPNSLRFTNLTELYLPRTVLEADLIVSLPKLKTHHWAGVTLAMKNLFGVMPGICYGWPKNLLHFAGIPEAILDIQAAVRPHLAIVDGIIGMEGDGPIMGTPRSAGVLVMGTSLPAVDATCARLMGIDPWKISYLVGASGRLGPIGDSHITQRGEALAPLRQPFRLLDRPHLSSLRG
ncbi:MAG: DUF362 domain-containing protein [Isosphaeraceae bacterium]